LRGMALTSRLIQQAGRATEFPLGNLANGSGLGLLAVAEIGATACGRSPRRR
jgi:hypothetical protein